MRGKRQFTWMPTLGSVPAEGVAASILNGRLIAMQVFPPGPDAGPGQVNTFIVPVIPDAPLDNTNSIGPGDLVRHVGQEWFLERLVGKLFVAFRIGAEEPTNCLVGAGFFVARANDSNSGGGVDTPIGSASFQERNDNYSPINEDAIREPWIWRRTWLLGGTVVQTDPFSSSFSVNTFAGSVLDGPHIDAKSVRRIGNDDRLFFAISTVTLGGSSELGPGFLQAYLDLRVLGQLRKARNTGKF